MDKLVLRKAIEEELTRELDVFERAAKDAWEGATHEENRPEGSKDMRSTEASYVAYGQSVRVRDARDSLSKFAGFTEDIHANVRVSMGSVFEAHWTDAKGSTGVVWYFVVPVGGGLQLQCEGVRVVSLTPESPLGAAFAGRVVGDEIRFNNRDYELISLQ
ncbi:MAG: hypothetical protein Q8Q09_14315 [Deltaproteobacteria bacterium]|nr:hypothetical protein [Deltaproteobacteria bacterium]